MYKVKFHTRVQNYLSEYFRNYREYHEELYQDSWLWNEDMIIEWYIKESTNRKQEIITKIETLFSENEILWKTPENTIFIRWKTKYMFIEWSENSNTRYIEKLEMR